MTRRSGLGKGLSSLIPLAEPAGRSTADGDRPVLVEIPSPTSCPTRTSRGCTSTRRRSPSWPRRSPSSACCSRSSCASVDGRYQLIAGERRWRAAQRAGLADRAGRRPHVRRRQRRRAGARREPPPPGPHPARGGRGLPAADRGLRAHPRRRRPAGRQEPLGGHQHAAPARAAAGGPAPAGRRQAVGRPRPGAARHARPRAPGAPGPPGGQPRAGRCARSRRRCATGEWRRRRPRRRRRPTPAPAPVDGAGLTDATRLRPPGLLELEQLLADALDTRVGVQMGAKRGKVTIDFADLEDLERIYRLIAGER